VCRSKDKGNGRQQQPLNVVRQSEQCSTAVEEGLNDEYEESNMYYMSPASTGKSNPIQVSLKMDGQTVSMEVDTGASVSIISGTEHRRRWPGTSLRRSATQLRTYTGEPLKVVGEAMVDVIYGQQKARLPLVVVAGEGPCLMGRDWLQQLQLDWFWTANGIEEVPPPVVYSDSAAKPTAAGLTALEVDKDGRASFPGLQEIAIVLSSIDAF